MQFADGMLNQGVYSEGFARLWSLSDVTMSEVAPLFEAAMRELGVSGPSRADAKRLLVAEILKQIVDQRVKPLTGLAEFTDWVHRTSWSEGCDQVAFCKWIGLMDLYGAYWSYDELECMRSSRELSPRYYADELLKLEQRVVEVAHWWLASMTQC